MPRNRPAIAFAAAMLAPAFARPAAGAAERPPLVLLDANTGARHTVQLFGGADERGRLLLRKEARRQLKRIFRCRRTGRAREPHGRLVWYLYRTFLHFGRRPIEVVSGYRSRKTHVGARRSRHFAGEAVDFRIPGVDNHAIAEHLRGRFRRVGVGYYPNSTHVHLDVRPDNALWVDAARRGEGARYLADPAAVLSRVARGEPVEAGAAAVAGGVEAAGEAEDVDE